MNLKITKTELAKLILVAFPLGCSIFLLASFIVTYSSLQSASSEQAQIILLLYSSATVPILSVYLLCLSAYLLWKHTPSNILENFPYSADDNYYYKKRNPFKCNYCGGKLLFYSQIEFGPELRKAIAVQTGTKGTETFKVQKCDNPKCGRTYIWLEPQSNSDKETKGEA